MQTAIAWISAHRQAIAMGLTLAGTYHVGSAFVDTLPMPNTNSTQFYRWAFNFTNRLAANYSRAKASNGPAGMQPPKEGA